MNHFAKCLWVVVIILLISACEKEKIVEVEVEKEYSWEPHDRFLYNEKIQMNSFADGDKLHTIGTSTFSTVSIDESDSSQVNISQAVLQFPYKIQYKIPITSRLFAGISESGVGFYASRNPVEGGTNTWVSLPEIDSTFANFILPSYWSSESIVINDQNQCLIPYQAYIPEHNGQGNSIERKLLIVQLSIVNYDWGVIDYLDTASCTILQSDQDNGYVASLHAIDENFFVTGDKTLRVTSGLANEVVFEGRLYKIFKYKGVLYGFTRDELYKSVDDGASWQLFVPVSSDYSRINYELIDNELIGFYNSQIFHLTITDDAIEVEELMTDGLEGNTITSASLFKDKVYLTTLSGVFTKKLDDFFTVKTEESNKTSS